MTSTTATNLPSSSDLTELVEQVWASFLDGDITPTEPPADVVIDGKVLAWVSISSDQWTGHLTVTTTLDGARDVAAGMFQIPANDVTTSELADALGEIANMVGGNVKSMLQGAATLSLPQVVLDAASLVSPDADKLVTAHAQWAEHPVAVSLWERHTAEHAAQHQTDD